MDLSTEGLYDIFSARFTFANLIGAKYNNVCTTKLENKDKLIINLKSLKSLLEKNHCILCLENAGDYNFNAFVKLEDRSEEHTSELQSRFDLVCRLLLEKKKNKVTQ